MPPDSAVGTDRLFDPPGVDWTRVEFRLAWKRRLVLGLQTVFWLVVVLVAATFVDPFRPYAWIPVAVLLGWGVFRYWLIGRAVRNLGYAERDDDLWITSGALYRRLTVVPYGRMQLVDVGVGPLDRAFGLASVHLHTAASGTRALIPGLTPDRADVLRDRLTELGATELSGL